jgi:hypothetical protein
MQSPAVLIEKLCNRKKKKKEMHICSNFTHARIKKTRNEGERDWKIEER